MSEYKPFIFKLDGGDNKLLDRPVTKKDVVLLPIISYPLLQLGYHYFIHRTKDSMKRTKQLESKAKFYYIVNPFEHIISNNEEDLTTDTKKFFNMKSDDPEILSRSFYKMWEILMYFDISSKKDLNYAALAEGPGSFLQAVIKFRERYKYDLKKDKYFGVSILPEREGKIDMAKQFLGHYDNKYPDLINMQKVYPTETANKFKGKSDGDITKVKTISIFKKEISKSKKFADLITADGEYDWPDENFKEQESYQLILGEFIAAIRVQNNKGSFVLKLFETFTMVSLKIVYLISSFYEESYICKPLFSRSSSSEKYLICKGFKYDQVKDSKILEKKIKNLEEILEMLDSKEYLQDLYPELVLPDKFIEDFKYINISISNDQQIMINKIIMYIDGNNYYGEEYHNFKNESIKATKWWNSRFFKEKNDLNYNQNYTKTVSLYNMKEKQIYFNESI